MRGRGGGRGGVRKFAKKVLRIIWMAPLHMLKICLLGPMTTSYFWTQYCNKNIKRYCDICLVYLVLGFDKSLPWLGIEFYALKISMSFNFFFCNTLYKNV